MEQLSVPYRIALAALLVVAGVWFTVLKPGGSPGGEPAPVTNPTAALAQDARAARETVAGANAAGSRRENAAGADGAVASAPRPAAAPRITPKAAGAPAKAAAAIADRSAPLLRALDAGKVVVLLFHNRRASDDRAVRAAVGAMARREGRVRVEVAAIGAVGRYEAITRGAPVMESPTVLVIGPDRRARAVVGFTTTAELDQMVGDVLATARR